MDIATPIPQLDKNGDKISGSAPTNQIGGIEADKGSAVNLPDGLTAAYIISWCRARTGTFQKWFDPYKRAIEDYGRVYRTKTVAKVKSSTVSTIPVANSMIETAVSRTVPALLGRPKLVELDCLEPGVPKEMTEAVEDFLNERLVSELGKPRVGGEIIKSAYVDGIAFAKVHWDIETKTEEQPIIDEVTGLETGREEVSIQTGVARVVPIGTLSMKWEPKTCGNIQQSPWRAERSFLSLTDLYKMQNAGQIQGVEEIGRVVPSGANKDDWERARKEAMQAGWSGYSAGSMSDEKEYKIDEWWGCINWKDSSGQDQYGEFHWFMVEEQFLVMFDSNPLTNEWTPYISCTTSKNPGEVIGNSLLAPVLETQGQINTFSGKVADLIDKAADVPTYYGKGSGISGRNYIARTKGLIPVEDVSQIKEGNVNTAAIGETQNYTNWLIGIMRSTTPANEMAQGVGGEGDTATEASILAQSAGARFAFIITTLGEELVKEVAERMLWLYQQFGEDGALVYRSDVDGDSQLLPIEALRKRYQVRAASSASEQTKNQRIEQMKLVLEMAMKAGVPFNAPDFFAKEILPLLGVFNGKNYLMQVPAMPTAMPGMPTPGGPIPGMPGPAATGIPQPNPEGV